MWKSPISFVQAPSTQTYGYWASLAIPLALTQFKAHSGQAPEHPWHWNPSFPQQSTSCCSEKLYKFFLSWSFEDPSKAPVVLKLQQLPHEP